MKAEYVVCWDIYHGKGGFFKYGTYTFKTEEQADSFIAKLEQAAEANGKKIRVRRYKSYFCKYNTSPIPNIDEIFRRKHQLGEGEEKGER